MIMKKIAFICFSCILYLVFVLASCSNELEESVNTGNSLKSPLTRNGISPSFYVPQWWDGETQISGPIMNEIGSQLTPISSNTVDTCDYYFYFIFGGPFNSYEREFYNRIQMQYRYAPDNNTVESPSYLDNRPDSEWHNLGSEYPRGHYSNGVIRLKYPYYGELDVDAHHFPKDLINIRFRILHELYPITEGPDTVFDKNVLATKWTVIHEGGGVFDNLKGFIPEETGEYGYLRIHVSIPPGSRWYSYSGRAVILGVNGSTSALIPCEGTYLLPKPAKQGRWEVTMEISYSPNLEPWATREQSVGGRYDPSIIDVYASFSNDDFKE